MPVEAWTTVACAPKVASRDAIAAEAEGWSGIVLADSQNLAAELIAELALCVARTETLMIGPGVANSVTRHPAVLAGAMATLQVESGGRMVLGIGRGDSALAYIGFAPASPEAFRRYLTAVQGYLRREDVPYDPGFGPAHAIRLDTLQLGKAPEASRLTWLRPQTPKIPVDVAATGPKIIRLAAALAERITFSVGAAPDRVSWAIDHARAAKASTSEPTDLSLGVYANIAVHDDMDIARELVAGGLAISARFSVMHGRATGGATRQDVSTLDALHGHYDMTRHGEGGASHAALLDDDFARRNAVIGTPDQVLERLRALRSLGIERFIFAENFRRDGQAGRSHDALVREVLPEIRDW